MRAAANSSIVNGCWGRRLFTLALLAALALIESPGHAQIPAACCLPGDECQTISATSCANNSGLFLSEIFDCSDLPTCRLGACCKRATPSSPGGTCDGYTTEAECLGQCGVWFSLRSCGAFQNSCPSLFVGQPLPGDCNQNGVVTVSELVTAVNIALCWPHGCLNTPTTPLGACPTVDVNRNGLADVHELVRAVAASLGQCPWRVP